jgi:hypothetical protein
VRVVLDTNVVVSALVWGGTPYKLLQAAANGDIELVTSPALIDELRDVLTRSHLAPRLAAKQSSAARAIDFYSQLAIHVSPLATPKVVAADPDDDHVIACALAGNAMLVVSGDAHLLKIGKHQHIEIVSVAEAVRRIAV